MFRFVFLYEAVSKTQRLHLPPLHGIMPVSVFSANPKSVASSSPDLNSWEDYLDPEKIASFAKVGDADFLPNYEFGDILRQRIISESKDFRSRCRRFIDSLVDVILSQRLVSSEFLQGGYCFCSGLLLEGDNHCVFTLFGRLIRVLERGGVVSSVESKTAVEEFVTFVVDVRARHLASGCQAKDIADVITCLLSDSAFAARKILCRVFKLCCLTIRRPFSQYLHVEIGLDGRSVPSVLVTSCIRGIQSCVAAPNYKHGAFSTKHTMECVRAAISESRSFMAKEGFDRRSRICNDDMRSL